MDERIRRLWTTDREAYWDWIRRIGHMHDYGQIVGPDSPVHRTCAEPDCDEIATIGTCSFCIEHESDYSYRVDDYTSFYVYAPSPLNEIHWLQREDYFNRKLSPLDYHRVARETRESGPYLGPRKPQIFLSNDYLVCACCHEGNQPDEYRGV